jgi:hypothetical protein
MSSTAHDLPGSAPVWPGAVTTPFEDPTLSKQSSVSRDIAACEGNLAFYSEPPGAEESPSGPPAITAAAALPQGAIRIEPIGSVSPVSPAQDSVVFVDSQAEAIEFGLWPRLAPVPAIEEFRDRAWENQASPYPTSRLTPDATQPARFPLLPLSYVAECNKQAPLAGPVAIFASPAFEAREMTSRNSILPKSAAPKPSMVRSEVRFIEPTDDARALEMARGARLKLDVAPIFAAEEPLGSEPGISPLAHPVLLRIADSPRGETGVVLSRRFGSWAPNVPASLDARPTRFLPVRRGPVLPKAQSWPRISALPE